MWVNFYLPSDPCLKSLVETEAPCRQVPNSEYCVLFREQPYALLSQYRRLLVGGFLLVTFTPTKTSEPTSEMRDT